MLRVHVVVLALAVLLWKGDGRGMKQLCPVSAADGPCEALSNRHTTFLTLPAPWLSLSKRFAS